MDTVHQYVPEIHIWQYDLEPRKKSTKTFVRPVCVLNACCQIRFKRIALHVKYIRADSKLRSQIALAEVLSLRKRGSNVQAGKHSVKQE